MSIYDLFLKNKRNKSNISNPPRQRGHVLNAKTARIEGQEGTY